MRRGDLPIKEAQVGMRRFPKAANMGYLGSDGTGSEISWDGSQGGVGGGNLPITLALAVYSKGGVEWVNDTVVLFIYIGT